MNKIEEMQWEYLAEGNANIVLKNLEHNIVIRIRKFSVCEEVIEVADEIFAKKSLTSQSLLREMEYFENVIKTLVKGHEKYLLLDIFVVEVSKDFAQRVSSLVKKYRPTYRTNKTITMIKQNILVLPFLGNLKSQVLDIEEETFISMEIKPKWGILPFSKHLTHNIKKTVCRYCMQQKLKKKLGKIEVESMFCPLDLYGDCTCRVSYSINSLFQSPQNNMNVSINGEKIEVNDNSLPMSIDNIVKIIVSILYHDSLEKTVTIDEMRTICKNSKFKEHEMTNCLHMGPGGVLNLLRKLQHLSKFDIKLVEKIYNEVKSNNDACVDSFNNYKSVQWSKFLGNAPHCCSKDFQDEVTDNDIEICNYLVSSTFKDCSVIITFFVSTKNLQVNQGVQMMNSEIGNVYYHIKLIDLDPKLAENIPYYAALDNQIVETYLEMSINEEKP